MTLKTPKGTRDFLPEDKIVRDKIVASLKEIFELYGYNPLETPALELYDTLASKYAGGAEILKEVYTLTDNAERKLGLRYDLTIPFARVIAMNPEIKKPFKRYQIDRVWRDGPIKLGRYREFWQCDVDVVGIKSVRVDAELISLASTFFKKLGLDVTIFVNNRKLLNAMLDFAGVKKELQESVILSIDKLKKIGVDGVRKELEEKGIPDDSIAKALGIFNIGESENNKIIEKLDQFLTNKEGIEEIKELLKYCELFGAKNVQLNISLARGLSYYTGTVLEVFMNDESMSSSLAGGGRFDKMIGMFLGSTEEVPAVGMSFGLDVITDVLKLKNIVETRKSVADVYIIPLNTTEECIKIMSTLRNEGIKCDMDLIGRNIKKNMEYANKLCIPYVIIVGENELKEDKVNLKNMTTGDQKMLTTEEVVKEVM
jgi:histidyl-tRNA synthetase